MVDPDAHARACAEASRGGDHVKAASHGGADRAIIGREQAGCRHEGIADGLDLFEAVLLGELLKALDERLELGEYGFRRVLLGIGGKAHDVRKRER